MNGPIQALYSTGVNLYAILFNPVDGKVWSQTGLAWVTYVSGNWANYAVPLTEYTGSGYYRAAYPIASPDVLSTDVVYLRNGGAPTLGDTPISSIYQSQGVGIGAIRNIWLDAEKMAFAIGTQQLGSISGTPSSPTVLPTDLTNSNDGAYAGRAVIMTSGNLVQQAAAITNYDGTAFTLTILGFPSGDTPADTDTFIII